LHFNFKLFVIGLAYIHILSFYPTKLTLMVFIRDTAPANILGGGVRNKTAYCGQGERITDWVFTVPVANGVEYAYEK
jgi:hypothetical protein